MSGAPLQIALLVKADVSSGKGALEEFRASVAKTGAEARALAPALDQAGRAVSGVSTSAERAGQSILQVPTKVRVVSDAALAAAVSAVAGFGRLDQAAASYTGTLASVTSGTVDFTSGIRLQAAAVANAAQESASYRAMLDDVRASFNPVFAQQRQYQQQLERIADAEKLGAISALEAADARRRAAAIGGQPAAANINGMHTASIGAQGFDIGVTAAMGMNPMMIGMQQGSQLVQVMQQMGGGKQALQGIATGFMSLLNPMSLATIGAVAFGAAAIQWLTNTGESSKSLEDGLSDLAAQVKRVEEASKLARAADLSAMFGAGAASVRPYLQELAELERKLASVAATAQMKSLADTFETSLLGAANPLSGGKLRETFDIGRFDGEGLGKAAAVQAAADELANAKSRDDQIAGLNQIIPLIEAAADVSGERSKGEIGILQAVLQQRLELEKLKALEENAAGNARADEMVRQLQQRIALEQVALRFGQDSAEYRAEENRQARENVLLELEALGIDRDSEKAKQVLLNLSRAALQTDAQAKKAREDAHRAYLGEQDSQIAAMNRELSLLGATNAERIRATAIAEAEAQSLKDSASIEEARLNRAKALAKAEAEIALEREKSQRALQQQAQTDAIDNRIALARDPVSKANLEYEKEFSAAIAAGEGVVLANARALQARNRVMQDTLTGARTSAADMLDELAIRQQVSAQVAAGTVAASDANRVIQQELQLRPLLAAAAAAEGQEKERLTGVITGLRVAYAAQAAEERRQSQNDYLRGMAERVQQAQLELSLVGQTAEVRARVLAMVQAERDIRAQGLTGETAEYVRDQTRELVEQNLVIARQADAWDTVRSAGESAIDAVIDRLKDGDIKGAIAGLADELSKAFLELGVTNPLKNMLLGTDLGTLSDVGGLSGIWDRLTGKTRLDEDAAIRAASQQVQAMQVAAATVTINAGSMGVNGAHSLLGGMQAAANQNVSPLSNSNGVAGQIWDFFSGKGLAPHQVAAIVGHAKAESGFNPNAVGDNGNAYGLFQWNDRRHSLFDFIGGKQNLGNVNSQLEFAWKELMTSESGPFRRLQAAPDLASATWAWQGFERPSGYKADQFGSGMHFDQRLAGAQQALATFATGAQEAGNVVTQMGQTSQQATAQMGQMGQGMGQFGGALGQMASGLAGAVGGDAGGILGILLGIGQGLASGVPLYSAGGATPEGDPSEIGGIVHKSEYVFDAVSTRRIGVQNLEALRQGTLRGFRSGGYVGSAPAVAASANADWAPAGNVTFSPSFDLRGAQDPGAVEAAAERGMQKALATWERNSLPGRVRQAMNKPRNL